MASVSRNAVWLFIGRVLAQGLAFALTVLLARALGEDGFGRFNLITSIVFVGNVATTFGLDTLLIREVARRPHSPLPAAALRAQLILSAMFVAVVGGGVWLLNPQGVGGLVMLYSLSLVPLALSTVYNAILRAAERMDRYLMVTVTTALLNVLGAWAALGAGAGLNGVIGWLLVVQVISALLAGFLSRRTVPQATPLRTYDGPLWGVLHQSAGLVMLMILSVGAQRAGIFGLALLADAAAVGVFSAALRVVDAFRVVPYAVFGALFPLMARSPERRPAPWAAWGVIGGGAVVAATLMAAAPLIVQVLYGAEYAQAVGPLRLLALVVPLYGLTGFFDLRLVAAGREGAAARAAGLGLALTVLAMGMLTPGYGVVGVCGAVVLGEGVRALVLSRTL